MIAEQTAGVDRATRAAAPRTSGPRSPVLVTDLRFELFAVIFALGTIHHEIQLILEQQLSGPIADYLERSALVRPTVSWPSALGVALHVGDIVLALLILVLPWRRGLSCLLAATFLLSYVASPERTSSHASLMAFGLAVVLLFGVLQMLGCWRLTPAGFRMTDWYGWTLTGLTWLCALTYWLAAFHKLNPRFFRPATSPIRAFVMPFADLLGIPREGLVDLIGHPLIVATVLTELTLPFLLWYRPTRLYACLLGVVFHLVMMSQGVMDFPIVIMAFYPLFLSVIEVRRVLAACLWRPSLPRLVFTSGIGVVGAISISRSAQVTGLADGRSGSDLVLTTFHSARLYVSFVLFVHVAASLVLLLIRQPRARPPARLEFGSAR